MIDMQRQLYPSKYLLLVLIIVFLCVIIVQNFLLNLSNLGRFVPYAKSISISQLVFYFVTIKSNDNNISMNSNDIDSASSPPEQLHLSYSGDPYSMIITWITLHRLQDGYEYIVEYGFEPNYFDQQQLATTKLFIDPGSASIHRYVHRAIMSVIPNHTYYYHVGSRDNWSRTYHFRSLPTASHVYRICIFGDLGFENGISFESIRNEVANGQIDLIIHMGDISYDLWTENGTRGDKFLRQIESIAAYVPYMTVAGNHERAHNFAHYENLFTMTANLSSNQYYSFDLGMVHFIAISTELYYINNNNNADGNEQLLRQYLWLQADLKRANENRNKVPWLIIYMHRLMYASYRSSEEYRNYENKMLRIGTDNRPGLESLFYNYSVDVGFWGHEHAYERMWPIYNRTVYNITNRPYHNAVAPIYILSGAAGCISGRGPILKEFGPWYERRITEYGYTIMTIVNRTHLLIEHKSTESNSSKIVDRLWISKDDGYVYSQSDTDQQLGVYVP